MNRTAADVEREVEVSRSHLDRTMEALKDKMTPGQLFDEASRAMGGAGQQVFSKFVSQAKENPMPLAVMGLGLAWLMTSSNRSHESASAYSPRYRGPETRTFADQESGLRGAAQTLGDKAHSLGDKAADVLSEARQKLTGAASSATDAGRQTVRKLGSATSAVADRASEYRQQAQRGFGRMLESEPLLIGAAGLLVGAAIGAALPSTEVEDHAVGSMRDKLVDKTRDLAQGGLQQAGQAAQAAYASVKDELANPGSPEADPVQKVADLAKGAVQAGREEWQNQNPTN